MHSIGGNIMLLLNYFGTVTLLKILNILFSDICTCWLALELKEKNFIMDRGLNPGLQLYVLVL